MLTHKLENKFYHDSTLIKLNITFNNVLLFYELQNDDAFTPEEKIMIGFDLICKCRKKLTLNKKAEILNHVTKTYIIQSKNLSKSSKKDFDFKQDAKYIYASFMDQYGIDLYNEIDKLDWRKFIWLFQGLGNDTKINKVIEIRNKKIPEQTKDNGDYIQALLEAKTIYGLEFSDEERKRQFADGLKSLAKKFIEGAKK